LIKYFFYLKDQISEFVRFLMDNIQALNNEGERSDELKKYQELLDCWNNQYKITKAQLKLIIKRPVEIVNVTHKLNLAKKYLKKKVLVMKKLIV
jgi:hypothetical protein